jgi:hypothetical protein
MDYASAVVVSSDAQTREVIGQIRSKTLCSQTIKEIRPLARIRYEIEKGMMTTTAR